jgi:Na+:H+ antiporter, NhaA family
MKATKLFQDFFESEKSGGLLLIFCTLISLTFANLFFQEAYTGLWHLQLAGNTLEHWINDGLMTIFFLLIGLELEREFYIGELSNVKKSLLPIFAAIGGMCIPSGLYLIFNYNTESQSGAGIPMATDIAFALGILSLLGNRVPLGLKILLTAIAVIDDLGAIIVIALFYSKGISWIDLGISMGIFAVLLGLNQIKVHNLIPYLIGGIAMWYFMSHSGVHATITGVLLAFAIPFGDGKDKSPSYILQHFLHKPVAFFVLPVFALANTCIAFNNNIFDGLTQINSIGIGVGLIIGKPLGIVLFSFIAVSLGICTLPDGIGWKKITGVGFLGGIGFTMSIFITLLAFDKPDLITSSKIAILTASIIAGVIGYLLLKVMLKDNIKQSL